MREFLAIWLLVCAVMLSSGKAVAAPSFEEMFRRHNAVMLLIDPTTGEIVDANPSASDFYGYTRSRLRTMKIQDINTLTPGQVAAERSLAAKEKRNYFIFQHRLNDGSVRTVEVHSSPYYFAGRQLLLSIIRDISKERALQEDLWHYQARLEEMVEHQTADIRSSSRQQVLFLSIGGIFLLVLVALLWNALRRRKEAQDSLVESENRYKEIVEKTSDLITRVDREGRFLYVNHMAEKVLGLPAEECVGLNVFDFVYPDDRERTMEQFKQWLEEKRSNVNFENRLVSRTGEVHMLNWTINLRFDSIGQVKTMTSIGRDITARVETERALEKAVQEAEQASRAKSEFLASMSHELRTPLNAVLGFAQILRLSPDVPLTKKQEEYVDNIEAGGQHLLQLVGDILDLAKIEADQIRLFLEYVDPKSVVDECVALIRHMAAEKNITIENGFVAKVFSMVRADPIRLKQGMVNLLTNAVRYNVEGGKVTVEGEETEDGFLRITVDDTGVGIDERHREDIFTIFHRLDQDPGKAVEGAGIGLAVTKQLVERMGGRIDFVSTEGKGSTFWIDVPLVSNQEKLIWADNLSVRVPAIDTDHKELIRLINAAGEPSLRGRDTLQVCKDLVSYTLYHFRREETIMEACEYPDIVEHKERHRALEAKVKAFLVRLEAGDITARTDLRDFLRDWLVSHIMNVDRRIYEHTLGKEEAIDIALSRLP